MKNRKKHQSQDNIVNPNGEELATFATVLEDEKTDLEDDEEFDYNYDLFQRTVANIRNGLRTRLLTREQAEELEIQALNDYRERLAEDLGYDPEELDEYDDEDDDDADYSDGTSIAEFRAANDFGAGLQVLLADAGYEDLEEGVADLAANLGLDPEDVAGLFTGDFVPHPELEEQIADIFDLDDETAEELFELGEASRLDAGYGDEDDDEDEEEGEGDYAAHLENQLAEFQFVSELKDELASLELEARTGIDEGWLPPIVYRELIGDFELEKDKIVAFSACCEASGVDAPTQLYAINYTLEAFKRCGPLINFSSIAEEPLTEREVQAERSVDDQARRNYELRRQRNK